MNTTPISPAPPPAKTSLRKRLAAVLFAVMASSGLALIASGSAQAWAWDPNVNVIGTTSTCVPNDGGWMWYSTSDGDSGWASTYSGVWFTLPLHHVPTSGSVVTLKWGHGGCSQVRYFVVHRPAYSRNANVGNLG